MERDAVWWQGGLMKIRARAEDTGGAVGVLDGRFSEVGYGPPLHVHSREDEGVYVLEGAIRFRVGDDEFVAGPGTWVWQPLRPRSQSGTASRSSGRRSNSR